MSYSLTNSWNRNTAFYCVKRRRNWWHFQYSNLY